MKNKTFIWFAFEQIFKNTIGINLVNVDIYQTTNHILITVIHIIRIKKQNRINICKAILTPKKRIVDPSRNKIYNTYQANKQTDAKQIICIDFYSWKRL